MSVGAIAEPQAKGELTRPCCAGRERGETALCQAALGAITAEIHQFAESLGKAIDARDHFTMLHSEEVAILSHILALGMRLPPVQADRIHIAGHLHDVGKLGAPDRVLLKEGPLTTEEWGLIERHPVVGAEILLPVDYLAQSGIARMVLHHHERYDGGGYPAGLAGEAIPLGARVIALADSLSAMLQKRPYRPPLTFQQAEREICRNSGCQFDPQVVRAFLARRGEISAALGRL